MSENQSNVNQKRRTVAEPKVSVTLKRLWKLEGGTMSLRAFARMKKKEGDAIAKRWWENKQGKHDTKRSDKNASTAKLASEATKNSRRKAGKK